MIFLWKISYGVHFAFVRTYFSSKAGLKAIIHGNFNKTRALNSVATLAFLDQISEIWLFQSVLGFEINELA